MHISYSLFGTDIKYLEGMIINAIMMPRIYEGCKVVCYFEKGIPSWYILRLEALDVAIVDMSHSSINPYMWRFLVNDMAEVKCWMSRDADSRPTYREYEAVKEWLASDKQYHTMHDHPNHRCQVMGGMFGIKTPTANMKNAITQWKPSKKPAYNTDQFFLEQHLHLTEENTMSHRSDGYEYSWSQPFPTAKKKLFVGQIVIPPNEKNQKS